jgi:RNA-dependent RNA polymerase
VQLSKGAKDRPQVMLGPMILARNPALHPGDIRVVRGVDVPALHHLKDVVVLPQTGDKALSTMCAGGDLDGDDYLVIWDRDLLPKEWNHEPMNYDAAAPVLVDDVRTRHIIDFFVDYIKNDSLGTIATAHLIHADREEEGPRHPKCTISRCLGDLRLTRG